MRGGSPWGQVRSGRLGAYFALPGEICPGLPAYGKSAGAGIVGAPPERFRLMASPGTRPLSAINGRVLRG